jgi:hypothetical protein
MKTKLYAVAFVALLALSMFAVLPVFSWEPPPYIPPSYANVLYIEPQEETFVGPCTESRRFNATVNIYNVTDLYAWDIYVYWDTTYLELEGWKLNIPAGWAVDTYQVLYNRTETAPSPFKYYHFAVTRLGLVSGFNGSMVLAELYFHIIIEFCWPDSVTTGIKFSTTYPPKLSNGCGVPIPYTTHDGTIIIKSSKPNIEILFSKDPEVFNKTDNWAQGWINCTRISAYVWVSNVTKFYGMSLDIYFDPNVLETDIQHIFINEEKFTWPWTKLEMSIHPSGAPIQVHIERPNEEEKWLKGTFWMIRIDFHVKCVMNTTNYDYIAPYGFPINATTTVTSDWALAKLYMCGREYKYTNPTYNLDISWSTYYWTPIPYDFDQNGHVGISDILIILKYYGKPDTPFDLDKSGTVDIYDVVKVAKAYCTKTPPKITNP